MTGKYSDAQRREYLELIDRVSRVWLSVFENNRQFYSTDYWDLLSRMWQAGAPVRKTDALDFMTAIKSTHTAGKYLDTAMRYGYIIETENPNDARSKLVDLSSDMRPRLDEFFDIAVDEVLSASDAMKPPDTR